MSPGPGTRRHTSTTPRTTYSLPHHQQRHSRRNNCTHHPQPGPLGVLRQHFHREIPEQFTSYDALVPRKKQAPRHNFHIYPPRAGPHYAGSSWQATTQETPTPHHPLTTSPRHLQSHLTPQLLPRRQSALTADSWSITYNIKHATPPPPIYTQRTLRH